MTKFCTNCGEPIVVENAYVCSNCGRPTSDSAFYRVGSGSKAAEPKTASYLSSTQTKSPFFATVSSYFWPGLGQVYNGRFWKGIFLYIAIPIGLVCLILPGLALWVWSMWDAYKESEKMNNRELPYAEPTAWQLIIFLCIPFILYFVFIFGFVLFLTALMATV